MNKILEKFGTGTLLMLSLCTTKVALAGERGGNGGDAVVCPDAIYMLDSVESLRRGHPIVSVPGSLKTKVSDMIDRIGSKDKIMAREIRSRADQLLSGIELIESTQDPSKLDIIFTDGELVNVADEGATYIPAGCRIEQLIIQNKKPLPGDPKFLIQRGIWYKMNDQEKAVGVLHEAVYGYLLDHNIQFSPSTRYYTGLIASGQIIDMKDKNYLELLYILNFPDAPIERFGMIFNRRTSPRYLGSGFLYRVNIIFNQEGDITKILDARLVKPMAYLNSVNILASLVLNVDIEDNQWKSMDLGGEEYVFFNPGSLEELKIGNQVWGGPRAIAEDIQNKKMMKGLIISNESYSERKPRLSRMGTGYRLDDMSQVKFQLNLRFSHVMKFNPVVLELDADFNIVKIIGLK